MLGFAPDYTGALNSIPGTVIDKYITRANFPNTVPVTKFTGLAFLKTVNFTMLNRLVQIDSVEFIAADLSKTYSDSLTASSVTVEDCSGNKLVLRTSNFANFHGVQIAQGKGSITALYTVYNSTPQLVIRDTSDIRFYNPRCNGSTPPPPGNGTLVSLDSIRKLYQNGGVKLGSYKVKGVVISDASSKNVSTGNVVLQDGNKGINIYFGGTITYNVGDSIVVDVTGDSLISYQGSLEIKTASGSVKPAPVATGKTVAPAIVTVANLIANFSTYESTLVKILNATISGGTGTYSGGSVVIKDASSTSGIQLYTSNTATFVNQTYPTGNVSVQGIVTPFNTAKEIKLRNPTIDIN